MTCRVFVCQIVVWDGRGPDRCEVVRAERMQVTRANVSGKRPCHAACEAFFGGPQSGCTDQIKRVKGCCATTKEGSAIRPGHKAGAPVASPTLMPFQ